MNIKATVCCPVERNFEEDPGSHLSDLHPPFTKPYGSPLVPLSIVSLGTGSVDEPSVLMEGVRGEHEHHNQ